MMTFTRCFLLAFCVFLSQAFSVDTKDTKMLRTPDIDKNHIAFVYDNDIWIADRNGNDARRLTTAEGRESRPHFSRDGKRLAFSAYYDGNLDVYVMPIEGGTPTRLTWHSSADIVQGFAPNGDVIFRSSRGVHTGRFAELFRVPISGGMPVRIPIHNANDAQMSPDGKQIVFSTMSPGMRNLLPQWKNYRGGTASRIWIMDLDDYDVVEIAQPDGRCNDVDPNWIGDKLYFNSDRNGEFNLFSYDLSTGNVIQVTQHQEFPVMNANGGDGKIIYEQAGNLNVFDPANGTTRKLKVGVAADLREARPRYVSDNSYIRSYHISPKGNRAVIEYRGEIVTVPAEKGDVRNITNSTGAHDRTPMWSPDGKTIAWFSDKSDEYGLHLASQTGAKKHRYIELNGAGFYENLKWSPDSKWLSFRDNSRTLYVLNVASGKARKVAQQPYYSPIVTMSHNWSPDSKWLAYTLVPNGLIQSVFLYAIDEGKSYPVTDGLSEVAEPVFDADGKYLYMLGSTDAGPLKDWFSQWIFDMNMTWNVYVAVLDKDAPSPLPLESDEVEIAAEKSGKEDDKKSDDEEDEDKNIKIDFAGLTNRIISLPVEAGQLHSLAAGKSGEIFYIRARSTSGFGAFGGSGELRKFTLKDREETTLGSDISSYELTADGGKALYFSRGSLAINGTGGKFKAGEGKLPLNKISVKIDPREEWRQIVREAWRINRDYFYATNYHGLNWEGIWKKYEPMIEHAATRADVGRIIAWLAGELSVGHSYSGGGESIESPDRIGVGLLGADFEVVNGRYRFEKVYGGLNWRPNLRSPLKAPGVNVVDGEYLFAVDGKEVMAGDNIYKHLQMPQPRTVRLKVGPNANGKGAREVDVQPVTNDRLLRWVDWVEGNIAKVDKATNGRVAYVHVPNTAQSGHEYFKRYFYPQAHKDAIIIDERYNGGGLVADYYIDILRRDFIANWATRYGKDRPTPMAAMHGPKVMIIDEHAGSGGDLLPWMFRKFDMGTLVGKRTWGGLVGILGFPVLMDGGGITAPNLAIWTEDGWIVENEGVPPDVEVEQWPKAVNAGGDPQLEKAIEIALQKLKENPPKKLERPDFPIRVRQ